MTSRIDRALRRAQDKRAAPALRDLRHGAAIPTTRPREKILHGLPAAGADMIELGMPFSDPMADGPAIQASSLRALKAGQTMKKTLELVRSFRAHDDGHADRAVRLLQPDLRLSRASASSTTPRPPASTASSSSTCRPRRTRSCACRPSRRGLNFIRLATPDHGRQAPAGGARQHVGLRLLCFHYRHHRHRRARRGRRSCRTSRASRSRPGCPSPSASASRRPHQAKAIAAGADGVVVGSALVNAIRDSLGPKGEATGKTAPNVLDLVKSLSRALRRA